MKHFIIYLLIVLTGLSLRAQNVTKVKFDQHVSSYKSTYEKIFTVQVDTPASSMVLGIDKSDSFNGSFIVIKGDTTRLTTDEENEGNSDQLFSNLISLSSWVDSFLFYPAGIKNGITFYYINARMKASSDIKAEIKKKSAGCSVPDMIEQSEWRAGLPDPSYDRINQKVLHVILHHTAGSNTDINYTQTVRDIYVYHTQVRGWSDIGYNYLIAPNGDIYKGRDPGTYEQDNVMGAHFCNSNSGTMGISMMGTFTDIVPADTAFQSLIALITWKIGREHLNPVGNYYHALNPELPTIAGHRDGCSTECPGSALYPLMDSIRNEVMKDFNECGYLITSVISNVSDQLKLKIKYTIETIIVSSEDSEIESIAMYDGLGRKIPIDIDIKSKGEAVIIPGLSLRGFFIIYCKTKEGDYSRKIIL